jgi:hypothetical protein
MRKFSAIAGVLVSELVAAKPAFGGVLATHSHTHNRAHHGRASKGRLRHGVENCAVSHVLKSRGEMRN